jgi:hypothetical protein
MFIERVLMRLAKICAAWVGMVTTMSAMAAGPVQGVLPPERSFGGIQPGRLVRIAGVQGGGYRAPAREDLMSQAEYRRLAETRNNFTLNVGRQWYATTNTDQRSNYRSAQEIYTSFSEPVVR